MPWWTWDEFPRRIKTADVDIWLGGPKADGRGLDAVNGGYAPAPGLTITSPSASTPASTARFLIRDSTGVWRDKQAGVLACIGGRVWTGSGWTYVGATNVEARGPLPAMTPTGITDTVRRYAHAAGRTVSDGPGGVVQPYSQRVDIADGQSGGGWGVWPVEGWTSVGANDFIYSHSIVEYPPGNRWVPRIGLYDGSFIQGYTVFDIDTLSVTSVMTGGAAGIRSLGTGPNGGRLVEFWTGTISATTYSSISVYSYLLRSDDYSTPRTCWIHHHFAVRIPTPYRLYGFPSCILVGAGAVPSLVAEELRVTMPVALPVSAAVRTGAADPADSGYYDALLANNPDYVRMHRGPPSDAYRWYPPSIIFSTSAGYSQPRTLQLRIAADNTVTGAIDGVVSATSGTNTASLGTTWWVGGQTQYRYLAPLRRVQLWSRHLSAAEVAAAHAAIVAAEA